KGERGTHRCIARGTRWAGGGSEHGDYSPQHFATRPTIIDPQQDVGPDVRGRPGAERPTLDLVEFEGDLVCTHLLIPSHKLSRPGQASLARPAGSSSYAISPLLRSAAASMQGAPTPCRPLGCPAPSGTPSEGAAPCRSPSPSRPCSASSRRMP